MNKEILERLRAGKEVKQTAAIRFMPEIWGGAEDEDKPAGYVAGWASTDALDSWYSRIETGAFKDAIAKRGIRGPRGIKFLIGHDWDKIAGRIEELEYRDGRLWIAAQFGLNISYVHDFYEAAKMQEGLSFSVGFRIEDYEIDKNDVLRIAKGDLFEVSAVPFPANEDCVMTELRSAEDNFPNTMAEFEKSLVIQGLAKSRRDANKIVLAIKSCPLFSVVHSASMPDAEPETNKPMLAETDIARIRQHIAAIRTSLNKG